MMNAGNLPSTLMESFEYEMDCRLRNVQVMADIPLRKTRDKRNCGIAEILLIEAVVHPYQSFLLTQG